MPRPASRESAIAFWVVCAHDDCFPCPATRSPSLTCPVWSDWHCYRAIWTEACGKCRGEQGGRGRRRSLVLAATRKNGGSTGSRQVCGTCRLIGAADCCVADRRPDRVRGGAGWRGE